LTQFKSQQGKDAHAQTMRMEYLEELYFIDGRDDPNHPQHMLFTGLAQQYGPGVKTDDN
jgi:hypothetical protein